MGKRARLKKDLKMEQERLMRQVVERRAEQKRAPYIKLARRVLTALIMTIVILYVGSIINHRLTSRFSKISTTINGNI